MNEEVGIARIPVEEIKKFNSIIERIEERLEYGNRNAVNRKESVEYTLGLTIGFVTAELNQLKDRLAGWSEE
jgi:hypothetical protein